MDSVSTQFHSVTKKRYIRSMGKVLAEYEDDGFYRKYSFIYAGDQRIAMLDSYNHLHFYLNDHLGSARLVIDSAGTIVDNYTKYFAYGAPEKEEVSTDQQYKYTGKPYDTDGGINLYYYGARYYDPELGRFISLDPMRLEYAGISPYIYCAGNPIAYLDVDGQYYVYSTRVATPVIDNENGIRYEQRVLYHVGWNTRSHELLKAFPIVGFLAGSVENSTTESMDDDLLSLANLGVDVVSIATSVALVKVASWINTTVNVKIAIDSPIDDPRVIQAFYELYGAHAIWYSEENLKAAIEELIAYFKKKDESGKLEKSGSSDKKSIIDNEILGGRYRPGNSKRYERSDTERNYGTMGEATMNPN